MKVIAQLIRHFWQRGALTPQDVQYLLRHGFCRKSDVPGFKPPISEPDLSGVDLQAPPIELPDQFDQIEETLIRRARPRNVPFQPRRKQLTEKELLRRLGAEYDHRATDLCSLVALCSRIAEVDDWKAAASQLHSIPGEKFHRELCDGLRDQSVLLGDLWQASDPEPFHDLLNEDEYRGRAARAYQAVLIAAGAESLGPFTWILKHDDVHALINLLVIHRRLLTSLQQLYQQDRLLLSHAIAKNNDLGQVWSLVILYNSYRDPGIGFEPDYGHEYGPVTLPRFPVWRRAWTSALHMDRAAVTKFLACCYDGNETEQVGEAVCCLRPLMCPVAWHIPDDVVPPRPTDAITAETVHG